MNKYDIILIISLVFISITSLILMIIYTSNNDKLIANIYYKDELLTTINLYEQDDNIKTYNIDATNGELIIEYKYNNIRVSKETSNYNLCSKQSWSSSPLEPIICLPNEVYIEIIGKSDIDVVI